MGPFAYDDCVFINCPFDTDYQPLFRAIVFTVADCGFVPRCALEKVDTAEPRITKILRIIGECRYGVHDISATELYGKKKLPRFNMPLELGIFLGAAGSDKRCIVLDREPDRYQRFCSDIAGQDIQAHNGNPADAARCIRDWLQAERTDSRIPGGAKIFERYEKFCEISPVLCEELQLAAEQMTFGDFLALIERWLKSNEQWESETDDSDVDTVEKDDESRVADTPSSQGEQLATDPQFESEDRERPWPTARDFLESGLVGMWKDREDIEDSSSYARILREKAQRR